MVRSRRVFVFRTARQGVRFMNLIVRRSKIACAIICVVFLSGGIAKAQVDLPTEESHDLGGWYRASQGIATNGSYWFTSDTTQFCKFYSNWGQTPYMDMDALVPSGFDHVGVTVA